MSSDELVTFDQALGVLADERALVTSDVLYAMSGATRADVEEFQRQWPLLSPSRRRQVIAMLVEGAESNFELDFNALFRAVLDDTEDEVRRLSVEGLWEDESATLVGPLVALLRRDEAMEVRASAAASLGRFVLLGELGELAERYVTLARGALLEAIDDLDEHVDVRRRAVESIAYLGEECVRDIISAAYDEVDEDMRLSAVFSMGRSGDAVWSATVLEELLSENPAMRYEAARASGELEIGEAIPLLIRLVSDVDREVQFAAISALGQIGGKRAREVLQECCQSADEAVQLIAEDALAELDLGQQPLDLLTYQALTDEEGAADED